MGAIRQSVQSADQHREVVDVTRTKRPQILMVVANPTTATTTGWPVGFWASELTHPYYAFTRARYDVVIASPNGGPVKVDTLSDPRDASKWSAEDLISMGFLNTPELVARLEDTPNLADLDLDDFDALVVCGGLAPMFQFREHEALKKVIATFYEAEKPTAVLCHGVSALIDTRLSDGSYIVEGKTVTGFSNAEEEYSDNFVGQTKAARPGGIVLAKPEWAPDGSTFAILTWNNRKVEAVRYDTNLNQTGRTAVNLQVDRESALSLSLNPNLAETAKKILSDPTIFH